MMNPSLYSNEIFHTQQKVLKLMPKTHVSSSMRLVSTAGAELGSCVGEEAGGSAGLLFTSGSSSGLGCISVKGNSATRSLKGLQALLLP